MKQFHLWNITIRCGSKVLNHRKIGAGDTAAMMLHLDNYVMEAVQEAGEQVSSIIVEYKGLVDITGMA